jgi:hypothetical protein
VAKDRRSRSPLRLALIAAILLAVAGWASAGPIRTAIASCKVWTVVDSPKAKYGILRAADASASDDVWAVGTDGGSYPIVDHWDGSTWRLTLQKGVATDLFAVAAISATDVWAGGDVVNTYPRAFLEHWDGVAWSGVPAPTPGIESSVEALAAISATDVWAAGYFRDADYFLHPLYLHWDGNSWAQFDGGVFGGTDIHGLAALASDDVWAVGERSSGQQFSSAPLIQHWDGTSWRSVRPARIPGQGSRQFQAAASISTTDVWGVGYGEYSGAATEHWDGIQWTYMRASDSGVLADADAESSTDVWAVGSDNAATRGISEHWDGATWRSLPTPNPGGNAPLFAVVAVSPTDVWAVGAHADAQFAGNYSPLTMHSRGTC